MDAIITVGKVLANSFVSGSADEFCIVSIAVNIAGNNATNITNITKTISKPYIDTCPFFLNRVVGWISIAFIFSPSFFFLVLTIPVL